MSSDMKLRYHERHDVQSNSMVYYVYVPLKKQHQVPKNAVSRGITGKLRQTCSNSVSTASCKVLIEKIKSVLALDGPTALSE